MKIKHTFVVVKKFRPPPPPPPKEKTFWSTLSNCCFKREIVSKMNSKRYYFISQMVLKLHRCVPLLRAVAQNQLVFHRRRTMASSEPWERMASAKCTFAGTTGRRSKPGRSPKFSSVVHFSKRKSNKYNSPTAVLI